MGGDLNEILSNEEKMGGQLRDKKLMEDFIKCLNDCELRDMRPMGDLFTWHGNRRRHQIKERLDRFLCNYNFDSLFIFGGTNHLEWLFSDHKPIEIWMDNRRTRQNGRRNNHIKFEELWTKYEKCVD